MPNDELFKRYLEIGAAMLGMSRDRAESIVRDLVASGEVARSQATKAADWLVERGRAGTEELTEMVRREIRQQVSTLGLATKEDLAALQAQIDDLKSSVAAPVARKAARTATKAPAKKAAGATRPAGISRSASVRTRPPPPGGTVPPKD